MEAKETAGLQELAEVGAEMGRAQRGRNAADQAVPGSSGAAIRAFTAGRRHLVHRALRHEGWARGDDVKTGLRGRGRRHVAGRGTAGSGVSGCWGRSHGCTSSVGVPLHPTRGGEQKEPLLQDEGGRDCQTSSWGQ